MFLFAILINNLSLILTYFISSVHLPFIMLFILYLLFKIHYLIIIIIKGFVYIM